MESSLLSLDTQYYHADLLISEAPLHPALCVKYLHIGVSGLHSICHTNLGLWFKTKGEILRPKDKAS